MVIHPVQAEIYRPIFLIDFVDTEHDFLILQIVEFGLVFLCRIVKQFPILSRAPMYPYLFMQVRFLSPVSHMKLYGPFNLSRVTAKLSTHLISYREGNLEIVSRQIYCLILRRPHIKLLEGNYVRVSLGNQYDTPLTGIG